MELKVSDKKEKTKLALIAAVVGFALAFISAPFLLNQVYGNLPSEEYNETLQITKDATNKTEGNQITSYIEQVKQDICKTLVNETEYEGCMNI